MHPNTTVQGYSLAIPDTKAAYVNVLNFIYYKHFQSYNRKVLEIGGCEK